MDKRAVQRRWDNDENGHGVADGTAFAPGVRRLLDALHVSGWVAEEPDTGLLPHLRHICEAPDSPWRLMTTGVADAVYDVTLEWLRPDANVARLRADVFTLAGAIAEGVTYVHQQVTGDGITYAVISGMLDGEAAFPGHGRLVRFRVEGDNARRLAASISPPANARRATQP